jgi:hypothetical protein
MANQPPKQRLALSLTEPVKDGDQWVLTAVATVLTGRNTEPDVDVLFYLDGRQVDDVLPTDGEGRATKDFVVPKGTHTFEAKISGTGVTNRTTKVFKSEERSKRIAEISVQEIGSGPKQTLFITALTADKSPVGSVKLFIANNAIPGSDKEITIDADGTTKHTVDVPPGHAVFTIVAPGTSVREEIHLFN